MNLQPKLSLCRTLFPLVLLALSACQTTDRDASVDKWVNALPMANDEFDTGASDTPTHNSRQNTSSNPNATGERTSFFNGTGRFIGDPAPTRPASSDTGENDTTVNLVGVSVSQAAKVVLGDILGVKYTVDPGIEGKVTIQTPEPIAKSSVIDLFQSALKSNNAAVINNGNEFRIVPADQAAVGANIRLGDQPPAKDLGSHVQIIQLKYVSASEMKRLLEPISPRGGIVRADSARNTITLSGTNEEIASMLEAISIFDVDVMKGMSFALVPVTTAAPDAVASQLQDVFSSNREGPMAGMVRFVPNKQLSAILVISPQRQYLARATEWIHRLDAEAEGSEKQFYTYTAQNRPARELADVLQSMFSSETNTNKAGTINRSVAPQYQESNVQSAGNPDFPSMTGTTSGGATPQPASFSAASPQVPAQGASPAANLDRSSSTQSVGLDAHQDPRFKIGVDEGKNSLLIEATPADHRRIMKVINTLDVMPKQVLIEVTIAEISLTDELKFGVRWFFQGNGANSYTFTDDAGGSLASVFPGFSYALTAANITATLNALNDITKVNVISSPSLTVMNNHTAYLQVGDEVPITTQTAVSTLTTGAPVVNSISYQDTGVILKITPRINASGRVLLDLQQEVSSVEPTTSSGINSPTIRQRRIKTSVVLNNGEGLALGGLIQNSDSKTINQIPLLGNLPIIGNAFKQKDDSMSKTELLIFITPIVMRTFKEARWLTDEFRRELVRDFPPAPGEPKTVDQALKRVLE